MANGGWRKDSEPVKSIRVYLRLSAANKTGYGVSIHDSRLPDRRSSAAEPKFRRQKSEGRTGL